MANSERTLAGQVVRDPVHILAFGFGTGLSPVAPGTAGSCAPAAGWPAALVLVWALGCMGHMVLQWRRRGELRQRAHGDRRDLEALGARTS